MKNGNYLKTRQKNQIKQNVFHSTTDVIGMIPNWNYAYFDHIPQI